MEKPALAWAKEWLRDSKKLYIGGEWRESSTKRVFSSINPTDRETLALLSEASESDVDRAVTAASEAFEGPWSNATRAERAKTLRKIGDLIRAHRTELATLSL
jgi:aldehyde dehydrogenase (NAD+)